MVEFEIIPKIIGLVLAVAGVIGLIITTPTLLSSLPNPTGFIGSIVAVGGGVAILKLFS